MPRKVQWNRPEGGFFVWMRLPDSVDAEQFIEEAAGRGVAVLGGKIFYPDERDTQFVRLSYSLESTERLCEGVRIMSGVMRDVM